MLYFPGLQNKGFLRFHLAVSVCDSHVMCQFLPCSICSVPVSHFNVNEHQCPCRVSANIIPQVHLSKYKSTAKLDYILFRPDNHKHWAFSFHFSRNFKPFPVLWCQLLSYSNPLTDYWPHLCKRPYK